MGTEAGETILIGSLRFADRRPDTGGNAKAAQLRRCGYPRAVSDIRSARAAKPAAIDAGSMVCGANNSQG